MATIISKVDYIKIGPEAGIVGTKDGHILFLWWTDVFTEQMSAFDSVKYSMWISLLKDAITNDLEVEFIQDSDYSSLIVTIQLNSA